MTSTSKTTSPGSFSGVVVSDKMDKTVVVEVSGLKTHPKYHKQFRVTKRVKVHDPENRFHVGDTVQCVPSRPISKEKRWRVIYATPLQTTEATEARNEQGQMGKGVEVNPKN
ncbi:MAG: 30S ribosomal protein S17 [Patescibacteria group bacterium]